MNPFSYARPAQVADAVSAVSSAEGSKFIAGGTNRDEDAPGGLPFRPL